jgi:hypothetical protein
MGREREAGGGSSFGSRGTPPKALGWRTWFCNLFLILCQGWGVFFLGAVTLHIHRTGLAGFVPMVLLTALDATAVLAGWVFYGTGRRRTALTSLRSDEGSPASAQVVAFAGIRT